MDRRMERGAKEFFADSLLDLISDSGKTVRELAGEIGISTGSLSKYQNAEASANIDALRRISVYFGVSADALLNIRKKKSDFEDIQTICNITGLSKAAAKKLVENKPNTQRVKAESLLLESANIESALDNLAGFLEAVQLVDGLQSIVETSKQSAIEECGEDTGEYKRSYAADNALMGAVDKMETKEYRINKAFMFFVEEVRAKAKEGK